MHSDPRIPDNSGRVERRPEAIETLIPSPASDSWEQAILGMSTRQASDSWGASHARYVNKADPYPQGVYTIMGGPTAYEGASTSNCTLKGRAAHLLWAFIRLLSDK